VAYKAIFNFFHPAVQFYDLQALLGCNAYIHQHLKQTR
jgi:hypothetical protein